MSSHTPEKWPEQPSDIIVRGRVCRLTSRVWEWLVPDGQSPNDCFCGEGGFHNTGIYNGSHDKGYRNDGKVVMWLESAAAALAGIADPADFMEKVAAARDALTRTARGEHHRGCIALDASTGFDEQGYKRCSCYVGKARAALDGLGPTE